MPTYALLGATGSTGSAILRRLLSQPPKHFTLNIFVRSRSKLRQAFPDVESTTAFKINIIEGIPSETIAMQECLKDVDIVMACIGSNYSTPGMSLIYDTATAIIGALEVHRKTRGSAYKPPTILQLRSASLNPVYKAAASWIERQVVSFCLYYVYEDLDRACKLLASSSVDSPGLLDYIFIDPPSIHDADGVAFCEVAERRDEFVGRAVGVTATGTVNQTVGTLIGYMVAGAKGRIWG